MKDLCISITDVTINDVEEIVQLDVKHSGEAKADYWKKIVADFSHDTEGRIALLARDGSGNLAGFLFGEVRAWEFGSARCGWIFSVAVDPTISRRGVAGEILRVARQRFRDLGVDLMRTMVRRDDVPMAAFFRSSGFVAGPYAEMECTLQPKHDEETGESHV